MRKKRIVTLVTIFVVFLVALVVATGVEADGIFQPCSYLNDCETFGDMSDFTVTNYKDGIKVEGTIPDADLSSSGNPLEVIVTTGDVHTKCANTGGIKDITGDLLYRGVVTPGHFSVYIPLAEGDYNITVYLGQTECANCPQAIVKPITVNHNSCKNTGRYYYEIPGDNFTCISEPVSPELGGGTWAINRMKNPKYTETWCFRCGVAQTGARHDEIRVVAENTCDVLPECTACP